MSSLTRYEQNGIELAIDNSTGEAFATLAGYCRMSGVAKNTLANRLARGYQGVHKKDLKMAEMQTPGGLQGVHLIPAKLVFKWLMTDNPDLALTMGEVGATVYMHQLAGFRISSEAVPRSSILDRPDPWQRFYDKDFCDRAFAWFGAKFYWEFVYSELTPEEACKVNLLNPPINGVRADKIHQYLTPEAKTRLTPYVRELVAGLDFSPSRQDFLIGYGRRFGGNDQLNLPGM